MNERQRKKYDQRMREKRAAAIADETLGKEPGYRQDGGYTNMLNKYGTSQDSSTAYTYETEHFVDDMQLVNLYEGNGLFSKIIDRPAEEAVKHGYDIDYGDSSISEYVETRMDELDVEDCFATAEKWARLYGGAIIVMLINDGRGLDEELDLENAKSIEELLVFERAVVQPDYSSVERNRLFRNNGIGFGEPEFFQISSQYGYFVVHRSRCLVFRNGKLPEQTANANYRDWGIPEYVRIKRELRECITSHGDGVKLLERSAQAIYKMKNLANMLSMNDGEDKVLQRLQVIDMARSILNSIAIDVDGEDYDFKTLPLSGVKDVLDATCNMLSAVTNIPQTILFGRSPAGENATGDGDLENYYNMVENIQKRNMKRNSRTVIDLILKQGFIEGKIPNIPRYKVKFKSLWSLSEKEQVTVDQQKAAAGLAKAQTLQIYMDSGAIDPSEVRKKLAEEGDIEINEILSDDGTDDFADADELIRLLDIPEAIPTDGASTKVVPADFNICLFEQGKPLPETDEKETLLSIDDGALVDDRERIIKIHKDDFPNGIRPAKKGAAVLIIRDGKLLCAVRADNGLVCGPGGKIEDGETPEQAAVREAQEEFGITPLNLLPLGEYKASSGLYLDSTMFFTDEFIGDPEADEDEMHGAMWRSIEELDGMQLFPPFADSVQKLINLLTGGGGIVTITSEDGGAGSGNFGHGGRPGKIGGSAKEFAKSDYDVALKGIRTSDGKIVKAIDPHVYKRANERNVYPKTIATALKQGVTRNGNTGNRTVYTYNGTDVVFDNDLSMVKTVIYKGKKAKKGG